MVSFHLFHIIKTCYVTTKLYFLLLFYIWSFLHTWTVSIYHVLHQSGRKLLNLFSLILTISVVSTPISFDTCSGHIRMFIGHIHDNICCFVWRSQGFRLSRQSCSFWRYWLCNLWFKQKSYFKCELIQYSNPVK